MYLETFQLNRSDAICIYASHQIVSKVKVDNSVLQNVVFTICKKPTTTTTEVKEEVRSLPANCVSEELN